VLLLHGFTGSSADWQPFRPALERLTTPVAVDLLGHGASDAPTDPARHALERQADDLARLLHAQALAPAHVVGYSFGARVALRLALDHPEVVRSLVLESPSPGIQDPSARRDRQAADDELARLLEEAGIEAFVARWEALPLFATERRAPAALQDALRAARLTNDPRGLAASLRGAGQGVMKPVHDRLSAITVPTTVLAGAMDEAGLARARTLVHGIPDARLVVLDKVGHAPHREAPPQVARELAAHLVRHSSFCTSEQCTVLPVPVLTAARSQP
jgi:2-succinyl-6-hydroxy-2,4-cyclohexadiene-1-carboxylate synthase